LRPGDAHLGRVDDDDVVTGVHVRREHRLVLAADDLRDLGGEATEDHALGVDDEPLVFDVLGGGGIWLDAGVIVLSGFLLASHFLVGGHPFGGAHLGATRWLFLLYLVADTVAVLFVATAWFRRPPGVGRSALGLLTLGFALIAVMDIHYDQAVQRGTWLNGGPLDVGVAVSFTLLVLGLDLQRRRPPESRPRRPGMRRGRDIVAPIAIIAATLPLVILAWSPVPDLRELPFLVTGVAVLLVLVLARQHLARQLAATHARERAAADARFRSLVQRSSDAILQLAPDHTIAWASPSAGQLTGTIPALLIGRRITEIAHPEDRDRLAVFLANARESFSRHAVLHWRLGRADAWHDVESVVSDLTRDEAVHGLVLNTRDVSERVRLERQLRQSQKLEAVGRLSSGIAHDFNNILAAIITHAQLVRDQLPADDERAADLMEIEQTAQRGAVLTRRLLAFGRPEAGEVRTQHLSRVVRDMEPMLRRLLVSQVELQLDLAEDGLWVSMAGGQLEQVVMNLAINARDAMPGGGTVRVRTRLRHIAHGDRGAPRGIKPGRWAELAVADAGVGMDTGTLARLFEPFFTTKPSGLGTGLGLATVRSIVVARGGQVAAESAPGAGTTMRVYLPLVAEARVPGPADRAAPVATAVAASPVVLVVDDEVTLRRAMERFLARRGYTVLAAASAPEALALLEARAWSVDLVVTDMVMPRMCGREFVRRIRARAPELPVLCISGHVTWRESDAAVADAPWGPERLLAKPFAFAEFLRRVRDALGAGRRAA
jgi:PAS domain S-box-containing protein